MNKYLQMLPKVRAKCETKYVNHWILVKIGTYMSLDPTSPEICNRILNFFTQTSFFIYSALIFVHFP